MELGQRLRQARLEAGLSQRQLCGGEITRNMLSQIENGSARPSMATLGYLAARLGKSISYFLEEQTVTSPNQEIMAHARRVYTDQPADTVKTLEGYKAPDPVFDAEYSLLMALGYLALAEKALAEKRFPYAAELLQQAAQTGADCPYYTLDLERRRLLLLHGTGQEPAGAIAEKLPVDDRELRLRAQAALDGADPQRCGEILDAAWDRESPLWHLSRGEAWFAQKEYARAAGHFCRAEEAYPDRTVPRLEACYRELGDFKKAYEYACKQK